MHLVDSFCLFQPYLRPDRAEAKIRGKLEAAGRSRIYPSRRQAAVRTTKDHAAGDLLDGGAGGFPYRHVVCGTEPEF